MVRLNDGNSILNLIRDTLIKFTNLDYSLNPAMAGPSARRERRKVGRGAGSPPPSPPPPLPARRKKKTRAMESRLHVREQLQMIKGNDPG